MRNPADPILKPGDEVTSYSHSKHRVAEAILINLFHQLDPDFGCPKSHYIKSRWKSVHFALTANEYITPNGRFLTEKGFSYALAKGKEFTGAKPS